MLLSKDDTPAVICYFIKVFPSSTCAACLVEGQGDELLHPAHVWYVKNTWILQSSMCNTNCNVNDALNSPVKLCFSGFHCLLHGTPDVFDRAVHTGRALAGNTTLVERVHEVVQKALDALWVRFRVEGMWYWLSQSKSEKTNSVFKGRM